ncbi:uncharacterized protein E0L32_010920 [Thyridium curvatum]|uniref:Uncharacterized protein n=1 Tax=Thyridium curvatum TaxID=1093900 RepID=A0A507AQH0_9PEZI|nr:uncharacterized protein E0L32_010920 [Thyridium curvatum]TPX07119.1 hypothetical protein E0L32_010920 [Thyridium curvatum]
MDSRHTKDDRALEAGYPTALEEKSSMRTEETREPQPPRFVVIQKMPSPRHLLVTLALCFLFTFGLAHALSPKAWHRGSCHEKSSSESQQQQQEQVVDASRFTNMLDAVSPDSLHDLLHRYLPESDVSCTAGQASGHQQHLGADDVSHVFGSNYDLSYLDHGDDTDQLRANVDFCQQRAVVDLGAADLLVFVFVLPPSLFLGHFFWYVVDYDFFVLFSFFLFLLEKFKLLHNVDIVSIENIVICRSSSESRTSPPRTSKPTTSTYTSTLPNGAATTVVETSYVGVDDPNQTTSTKPSGSLQTNAAVARNRGHLVEAAVGVIVGGALLI